MTIGNTRTRLAILRGAEVDDVRVAASGDTDAVVREAMALVGIASKEDGPFEGVVLAGVDQETTDALEERLSRPSRGFEVYRLGRDLEVPIVLSLDNTSTVGQDRLLCALGAFGRFKEACVVIDAGTAITVDFVDGTGVFQGGSIAPGVAMMLRALHEHTAALPMLTPAVPDETRGVFGKDTAHAMQLGVRGAAVGLAQYLIDRYAESYGGYPRVLATGGDAAMLFEDNPLIERVVPDLQLMGLAEACRRQLTGEDGDAVDGDADPGDRESD